MQNETQKTTQKDKQQKIAPVSRSFLEQHLAQLLPAIEKQVLPASDSQGQKGSRKDSRGSSGNAQTLQQLLRHYGSTHRLGGRERTALQDAAFLYVRYRPFFHTDTPGADSNDCNSDTGSTLAQRVAAQLLDAQQADALDSETLLLKHSGYLPQWLHDALHSQRGDALPQVARALLQPAQVDWRVNLLKNRRDRLLKALQADGVTAQPTPYSPWGIRLQGRQQLTQHSLYQSGDMEPQDEGSQLLALLTGTRRDEMAVDFCAGAGGKTLALLAMMRAAAGGRQQSGKVYALDVSAARLNRLTPRLERSGADRSALYVQVLEDEHDRRLDRLYGKARRVLVDAPCSGTGTLRRQPEIKWTLQPEDVMHYQARQLSVLKAASRLAGQGGRLVYATCSLLREENEAVAAAFNAWCAQQGMAFQPEPVEQLLDRAKVPQAHTLCSDGGSYLRLWPDVHHTDGFFAACWTKV